MQDSTIWTEKYRPQKFSEIKGQIKIVERIKAFVEQKNMPHILLAGPAGVGKCIKGNTPLLKGNGELTTIEEAYNQNLKEVMSINSKGNIIQGKIAYFYKGKTEKTIYLRTERGDEVTSTPDHPYLILREGLPIWCKANELKSSDLIGTPTKTIFSEKKPTITWRGIPNLWAELSSPETRPINQIYIGKKRKILIYLEKNMISRSQEIAKATKYKIGTINICLNQLKNEEIISIQNKKPLLVKLEKKEILATTLPLEEVKEISTIKRIFDKTHNKTSTKVMFFQNPSPAFYEWLGYVWGDGHIKNSSIILTNKNEDIRRNFIQLSKELFGSELEIIENISLKKEDVEIKRVSSICKLLETNYKIKRGKKKAHLITVPKELYRCKSEHITRFIDAFYSCDGYYSKQKRYIEISSRSKPFIVGLKYLFTRLEILSKIHTKKGQYYLTISGGKQVEKFRKTINPKFKKIPNKLPEETNNDLLKIPQALSSTLQSLGIRRKELGKKQEIEYLFERKTGSRLKIIKIYKKIILLARLRIFESLKTIELMNSIKEESLKEMIEEHLKKLKEYSFRKQVQNKSKIKYDRLKEYYDHKRQPNLNNLLKVIDSIEGITNENKESGERIRKKVTITLAILETLQKLNISYEEIAKKNEFSIKSASTNYLLNNSNKISLEGIYNLEIIVETIKEIITERIYSPEIIQTLESLEFLSEADLAWTKVKEIREKEEEETVFDLNVEEHHNFIGGYGPLILHNSTLALVIAKELFKEEWKQNFLELNSSDDRGIDVVRNTIKEFAKTKAMGNVPFKIIFLDECDSLTKEAQQALRRTMETYVMGTRFILSANFSSKIIDPIQSRCSVFRFKPLKEEELKDYILNIAQGEQLQIDDKAITALVDISNGDVRRITNILQSCSSIEKNITEELIYALVSAAEPKEIKDILTLAINRQFIQARSLLLDTMLRHGLSGIDILKQIQKETMELSTITDEKRIELIDKCGEIEFRMVEGADEFIQLEALLASYAK